MYKIEDFKKAFSTDKTGRNVFDMIRAQIKKPRLSNEITTLEIELKAVPEYQAYLKDHEANVDKYGRAPGEKEKDKYHGVRKMIDEKCKPEDLDAYDKAETELLAVEVDRPIKKIPLSHFDDQEVMGTLMNLIYAFTDSEH